jgi:hypothetical protein
MNKQVSTSITLNRRTKQIHIMAMPIVLGIISPRIMCMETLSMPGPAGLSESRLSLAQDLNRAANHGLLVTIKELVEQHGANPDGENPADSPIKWAAAAGQLIAIDLLVRLGANPSHAQGALAAAAGGNHVGIVNYLIAHAAVVHPPTYTGPDAELVAARQSPTAKQCLENWLRTHYFADCPMCAINVNSHRHTAVTQTTEQKRLLAALCETAAPANPESVQTVHAKKKTKRK